MKNHLTTAIGPCWIVEHVSGAALIRRCFNTFAEVQAYETDKPMGMRSWNVVAGAAEAFQPVEVLS